MKKSLQYWGKKKPVCPWCDHEYDLDEHLSEDEIIDVECEECEKEFTISTILQPIKYETRADCVKRGEAHKLLRGPLECSPLVCQKCGMEVYSHSLPGGAHASIFKDQFEIVEGNYGF